MHHIITDGWSMGILYRELSALYNAFAGGHPNPLPSLPIQYADCAVWQRNWLQGNTLAQQLAYWKDQLAGAPPVLELPTDHPRPPVQTFRGNKKRLLLPRKLTEALKQLSQQEGSTLFMTLLAAFQVLLHRYTGQDDIVVGSPIANRNRTEIESLIGFFLNTLILRTDLSENPTVRELLNRVQKTALAAYEHQDVPVEQIIDAFQPERTLSHSPLFQVLFVLQNVPTTPLHLTQITIDRVAAGAKTAKLDLSLYAVERADGQISLLAEYRTDLFKPDTIERMLDHYQQLLVGIVSDPDQHLSNLPLLSKAERYQLLVEWNDTAVAYSKQDSLIERFESQVANTPSGIAFILGDKKLTYHTLNCQVNQLAHHLQELGVIPGTRVGLYLARSLEATIALLAIFKAGGVYVPLDPAYPRDRLAFMIKDAQVGVLLTLTKFKDKLPPTGATPLYLDAEGDVIGLRSSENPGSFLRADNPAYIIYTSGSTGKPKGVAVPHKQILNRLAWMWREYPFCPDEISCQKTALNFIDSLWELLGPLLQGTPTVIIPDEVLKDPIEFVQALAKNKVSRLWLVPSFLRVLLDTIPDMQRQLSHLKFWVTSGEAISVELWQRFQKEMPHAVLYNLYGTSEVWDVTWYVPQPHRDLFRVPIGRPIGNMQVFILDQYLNPVPIGVPGEIYVGGDGLARGYLNRPELTAEKFIPNPFDPNTNALLYCSGDIARYLPNGQIEFIERADHQVKIRGYRIELEEIESVLNQYPVVKSSVVMVREDTQNDQRLVVYTVLHNEQPPTTNQFRQFLKNFLPEYMIPSNFIILDAFPLTPSGKLDRLALPNPQQYHHGSQESFVAPHDIVEQKLVSIWEDLLQVSPISIKDDFFALGGHSLQAIRLFSRIEQVFSKKLPLAMLFRNSTIEQLANIIRNKEWTGEWPTIVSIQPGTNKKPFFCVHGFGGGIVGYTELASLLGSEQPFYGLQAQGLDKTAESDTHIEAMAARYINAMRAVQPTGPYYLGGYCIGGVIAFEMARQLQESEDSVGLVAIFEGVAPLRGNRKETVWSNPKLTIYFLHNVPYWFQNYLQLGYKSMWMRIRRKTQVKWKKLLRKFGKPVKNDASDIIDDASGIPTDHLRLMETQIRALGKYVPKTYNGEITLFRVRGQSLFRLQGPTMGWDRLSTGSVEVKMIAGNHNNILEQPHVRTLAKQLKESLEKP